MLYSIKMNKCQIEKNSSCKITQFEQIYLQANNSKKIIK